MENKILVCGCLGVIFAFGLSQQVYADELSDLKEQMVIMQRQMQAMQEKIESLEAQRRPGPMPAMTRIPLNSFYG
jgi:hypothetical protein